VSFYVLHGLLLEVVVTHLDDEDNRRTGGSDEVGDEEEDARVQSLFNAQHGTLAHKAETAQCHHAESRQRDAVGLSRTDSLNSLWQIAQNETYTT
jgi:hypothetical protein